MGIKDQVSHLIFLKQYVVNLSKLWQQNKVSESILDDLRTAGYFSLSVDSTRDWSHIDQLTVIVRYVSLNDGLHIGCFLTFLEIGSHTGESMAKMVHNNLTN